MSEIVACDAHLERFVDEAEQGAVEGYLDLDIHSRQVLQSIKQSFDADLLEAVRKGCWGVTDGYMVDEIRRLAEVHRQKAERVTPGYECKYSYLQFGNFRKEETDMNKWMTVYSSLDESELVDDAVKMQAKYGTLRTEIYRILKTMAFYWWWRVSTPRLDLGGETRPPNQPQS